MKLYLSSYRIPTPAAISQLVGKPLSAIKMAVIPNAKDYYAARAWQYKVGDFTDYLAALEIRGDVLDLRTFANQEQLLENIQQYDIIWAMGGNTFCLRYEMQRSGFDTVIRTYLESGGVYAGDSAGAIVAGKSLEGVEFGDEPAFAEETIWQGMGLVDTLIIPHADSPAFATAVAKMRERNGGSGNVLELTDTQALVIDGDSSRIVNT
jgi:dipeptidase E